MEIVTTQSEQQLIDMLSQIESAPESWLSLHVNISPMHNQTLDREGLSSSSLKKIRTISEKIAHKLSEHGLSQFEGKIMVFEDSDVLALFSKKTPDVTQAVLSKVRHEFAKNQMGHILVIEEMKDKLASMVVLSEQKMQSAQDYRIKRRAVEMGECLLEWSEPETEIKEAIQKKRGARVSNTVLVIEDDILMRGLVANMLKDTYEVAQAKDASSGLISYIDLAPNAVFLDIKLPGLSGNEVLKRLMQLDPQAYVVMLSGLSSSENVLSTHSDGAVGFLKKPFHKDKLRSYVKNCPTLYQKPA